MFFTLSVFVCGYKFQSHINNNYKILVLCFCFAIKGYTKSKMHSGVDLCAIKEKYTGKKKKPTTSSSGGRRTAKDDGNISCYQNRIR